MTGLTVAALVVIAAVLVELVLPGQTIYHAGWYSVALVALVSLASIAARRVYRRAAPVRVRLAVLAIAFGAAIVGFAGVASGLLAPDNQTVVGAPGQRIPVDDLGGSLDFPLAQAMNAPVVMLERAGHAAVAIGSGSRNIGSFILRTMPRTVVSVEARDPRGGHLTITQPTGTVFLSPVLLMQQRQRIAGMDLPYDSFAVPAAHRIVKAILFSPQEAAMMHATIVPGAPAVLLAVDDDEDHPLPHAIALAQEGQAVPLGGVVFHVTVLGYPAVEIVATPSLVAVAVGVLFVLAGFAARFMIAR